MSSHNIFLKINKEKDGYKIEVKISDLENYDFMEYGNMFWNYRSASVWSAPEVLKEKKMIEPTAQMDTYSFGMILWELWHQSIPFDNNI